MINNFSTQETLLEEFCKIKTSHAVTPRTFMQISGYPHFENVCSNILEFFFTSDAEHGFGDLFFRALMKSAYEEKILTSIGKSQQCKNLMDLVELQPYVDKNMSI